MVKLKDQGSGLSPGKFLSIKIKYRSSPGQNSKRPGAIINMGPVPIILGHPLEDELDWTQHISLPQFNCYFSFQFHPTKWVSEWFLRYECMAAMTGCVCQAMVEFQDTNLAADCVKKQYVLICLAASGRAGGDHVISRSVSHLPILGRGLTCNYKHDQIFIVGFIIC